MILALRRLKVLVKAGVRQLYGKLSGRNGALSCQMAGNNCCSKLAIILNKRVRDSSPC